MTDVLRAFGLTDKGRIRPTNEDFFAVREDLGLLVIADGMGGHNAGEVASHMSVETIVEFVESRSGDDLDPDATWPFGFDPALSSDGNLLRSAVHMANARVLEAAMADQQYAGMGTTIVVARIHRGIMTIAHAGDSRLYLSADGSFNPMTLDDSWMATVLAEDPQADPVLLQQHPMRNALTNVVGSHARTDVHVTEARLNGGELLLLTTDGVHGVLDDSRLSALLKSDDDLHGIAKQVIAAALARGSRDNCTAIVARYR